MSTLAGLGQIWLGLGQIWPGLGQNYRGICGTGKLPGPAVWRLCPLSHSLGEAFGCAHVVVARDASLSWTLEPNNAKLYGPGTRMLPSGLGQIWTGLGQRWPDLRHIWPGLGQMWTGLC